MQDNEQPHPAPTSNLPIRHTHYKWNKTADLILRAMEVVSGEKEEFGFLGLPLVEEIKRTQASGNQ